MKVRFCVNVAESFRRGIAASSAMITLEIDPASLPPDVRELIGQRLVDGRDGFIDVYHLERRGPMGRITAPTPDLDGLIEAVRADAGQSPQSAGSSMKAKLLR